MLRARSKSSVIMMDKWSAGHVSRPTFHLGRIRIQCQSCPHTVLARIPIELQANERSRQASVAEWLKNC